MITVCHNAEKTIERTIQSALQQDYPEIEYIVIDGLSSDGTVSVLEKYRDRITKLLSEKDHGMYDALNKGIQIATGEIVGILNADDVFAKPDILSKVAAAFKNDSKLDALFGDIAFISSAGKQVRYYSSAKWNPNRFAWGYMPAHPTFYCKTKYFKEIGGYHLNFEIAADYELLIRFLKINNLRFTYLPVLMVNMNKGGKSTKGLASTFKINKEIMIGCKINGIYTNYFMLYSKYFTKIFELGIKKQ
ncbi:MAG: glycosyltransferase family 2 protein [Bacteroidia bacterium]